MAEAAPPDVGCRIRELREQRGLSLRMLAEMSGLSINAISLIERAQTSPTVATLHRLAAALEVPIADFFGDEEGAKVVFVPADQRRKTRMQTTLLESLGAGLAGQRLQPFLVTLEPGAGNECEKVAHAGQELVFGLGGCVEYTVEDQTYRLGDGDALLLDASLPHCWRNASAEPARILLVMEAVEGKEAPFMPHLR